MTARSAVIIGDEMSAGDGQASSPAFTQDPFGNMPDRLDGNN